MDPMTILTLAKGAKWAWDQYKQTSATNPGNSVDELRARLDASEALIGKHYELIEAMEDQIRENDARIAAQAAEIARLDRKATVLMAVAATAATLSVAGLAWLAWNGLH